MMILTSRSQTVRSGFWRSFFTMHMAELMVTGTAGMQKVCNGRERIYIRVS